MSKHGSITVRYDPQVLTIDIFDGSTEGDPDYQIDLEQIHNSADALDWIMQVAGKPWMSDAVIGAIVRELDIAFFHRFDQPVQGVLCHDSKARTIKASDWKKDPKGPLIERPKAEPNAAAEFKVYTYDDLMAAKPKGIPY